MITDIRIDIEAVKYFLKIVKKEIDKHFILISRFIMINDVKMTTTEALKDLSITNISIVKDIIKSLTPENCFRISPDHYISNDYNTEIFEFLTELSGIKIYIKLFYNNTGVNCLSFHRSNKEGIENE